MQEVKKSETPAGKPTAEKIEGELSIKDLRMVIGGKAAAPIINGKPKGPIYNGRQSSPFKSRFSGTT